MANRRNDSRFFIYAPDKGGENKGTRLLGENILRKDKTELTVQDLIDFLGEQNIPPDQVRLPMFITRTKKTTTSAGLRKIIS